MSIPQNAMVAQFVRLNMTQKERLESIGFVKEQRLIEEVKELESGETIIYTTKILTDQELKDEDIKLSLS